MTGRDAAGAGRRHLLPTQAPAGVAHGHPRLTLVVRGWCHLCDDMRAALAPLVKGAAVEVVEVDADGDPALDERFGERVPVLLAGDAATGRELCHHRLDAANLASFLAGVAKMR
jgi:thiol-disulfide isomerase/thioredoxin